MFPVISVSGTARERGLAYGRQAAAQITVSIESYGVAFQTYAKLGWDEAAAQALTFEAAIAAVQPDYLVEMAGIAEGAGVPYEQILAINCRTEIMFSGVVRALKAGETPDAPLSECTSFAALPERTAEQNMLIGQNWDWMPFALGCVVVLTIEQDDRPNIVTVVEAGLLAKTGINSAGIGLVTNALVTAADVGEPGLPYHVALRRILDSNSLTEATDILGAHRRASSASYIVGSSDGFALNIECQPGDARGVTLMQPVNGFAAHTNHFCAPSFQGQDMIVSTYTDTLIRLQSIERDLKLTTGVTVESIQAGLRSHANYPTSVCTHTPATDDPMIANVTITSVVMDLTAMRMWVTAGNPCVNEYEEIDLAVLAPTAVV